MFTVDGLFDDLWVVCIFIFLTCYIEIEEEEKRRETNNKGRRKKEEEAEEERRAE